MVEGEGLDGQCGGSLVLTVAHHCWTAVSGSRQTTFCLGACILGSFQVLLYAALTVTPGEEKR